MILSKLNGLRIFYQELFSLIDSKITVLESIEILSKHLPSRKLRNMAKEIKKIIERGNSLSDALGQFSFFPKWHSQIIRAGEVGGNLNNVLDRIVNYLEKEYDTKRQLITGLIYPIIMFNLAIFLIPLANILKGGVSGYFSDVIKIFIPIYALIFIFVLLIKIFSTYFKPINDCLILFIPFLGRFIRNIHATKFIRTLQCLCESGVTIVQGWEVSTNSCDNWAIKKRLGKCLTSLTRGGNLQDAFEKSKLFPGKTISMIATTNKSGDIGAMLGRIAIFNEKQSELITQLFIKIFPIFIYLIVAAYIGFKVITFYMKQFNSVFSIM